VVITFALLVWAGHAATAVEAAPSAATVSSPVVVQGKNEAVEVLVALASPAAAWECHVSETPREVVLDLAAAPAGLLDRYEGLPPVVKEIVSTPRPDGRGVSLRIVLGVGRLSDLGREGDALRLRFTAPPARNPGFSGAAGGDGDYRVGPGDKLDITVFGHDDLTKVAEVRGDGTIKLPLIGDIKVAGKSAGEIDDELTRALGKDYLVDPQVTVDVHEYQSQSVTLLGEVRTPGRYVLKRNMRLVDLLAEAGGPSKEAGSEILVHRAAADGPGEQFAVPLEALFQRDNDEANMVLHGGDVITIAERQFFYVKGEVMRPNGYYLEGGMTLLKAISLAGGLSQFANRREVEILHADPTGKQERIVISLKEIESGKRPDPVLKANDIINVPRRIF
jgi:polysaccharide export outer membrane protein